MTEEQGPTLGDAYTEACQALGEEIVRGRLMAKRAAEQIERLTAEVEELRAPVKPRE